MKLQTKFVLTAISIMVITSLKAQLGNDLILHYSFNNADATDDVGNQDGTINGPTPCEDRFGNQNKAFQFSNNSITRANLTFNGLTEATVSFWLKPDVSVFSGGISNPVGCGLWGMYLNLFNSDGTATSFMDGSSQNNSPSNVTSPVPTTTWFHFVTTNDGTTTKIYINGQLEAEYLESFLWIINSYNLNLGFRGYGDNAPANYYNGKLDDLRIYSHAMDEIEIEMLYTEPNPTLIVDEKSLNGTIKTHPNPSNTGIYIFTSIGSNDEVQWMLYNHLGEELKSGNSTSNIIDISSESNGIYYVVFKSNDLILGSQKLSKID